MAKHPHQWTYLTWIARKMCTHCGLLWLRNDRSEQAARAWCRWWDD